LARNYAAFLGALAFITATIQGAIRGVTADKLLLFAWFCLCAFAAVGAILGAIAAWVVDDAVRSRVAEELAAAEAVAGQKPRKA
jgi:membrane protein YqaA with SNARE-associated domain